MSRLDETLHECFAATFPELEADAIPNASVDTVEFWDSLRAVTLMAVLEEEFDLEIPPERLPDLRSYAAVREYLQQQRVAS